MIEICDTTLRDGSQAEGISFSLDDKLKIAKKLDELGVQYIEGGWPGSNPKDTLFFKRVKPIKFDNARIVAFGSTRKANTTVEEDVSMRSILDSGADVATIFGKSWDFHVREVLKTELGKNLEMIRDSIRFLRSNGLEVIYDAEHFFDGFKGNADYAMQTIEAARSAGARVIVLCDTNGGSMPFEIAEIVKEVRIDAPLGIHAHNDSGMGVANSIMAVKSGAIHVQGTVNGYGERSGNADLCSVIPDLKLKMGMDCITDLQLKRLTEVSRYVSELANLVPRNNQPYVGRSSFTHKAGIHADAVLKNSNAYEHADPELVGNSRRTLVSELAGRKSILSKMRDYGISLPSEPGKTEEILDMVKSLENEGYQFEGAEASFVLLLRRALGDKGTLFDTESFEVTVRGNRGGISSTAIVELEVDGKIVRASSTGNGPVNALDGALRKVLAPLYPKLKTIRLTDYKVRVLDAKGGTAAKVRVLIDSSDGKKTWSTVGISSNIVEASWHAIVDSLEYGINGGRKKRLK